MTYGDGHRVRVRFRHDGEDWAFPLTDVELRERAIALAPGTQTPADLELGSANDFLLTLSMADEDNGWHSKLVAAVVPLQE